MAGNGTSLVRPKGFVQNPLKIAAGSPLAIQGIFIEILRERFQEGAGLDLVWRPDITESDIVIEAAFNAETESRSQVPAVYIDRLQTVPSRNLIGDRVGVSLPPHLEGFGALNTVAMNIDVVSNDEGESAVLADLIQFTLLASQDVIQREFGFYDFSHPSMGRTEPFEREQTKWNTSIQFTVQFWVRWTQVPIAPLLQQIATRVSYAGEDPGGHFVDTTINSLKRGEVLDITTVKDGIIPASRVSIVGPAGPAGAAGPPGAPGAPGVSLDLRIDQPLTGLINGVNLVFTTSIPFIHTLQRKELFYINGVRMNDGVGNDYVVSESVPLAGYDTLTLAYAPLVGDTLTLDFYPDV